MKRYDEEILEHLVDSYEKSLVYSGKNKGNRGIIFSIIGLFFRVDSLADTGRCQCPQVCGFG